MLIMFFVSTALTVPSIPSETDEVIETQMSSVVNLGLLIIILLNVIYAQLFIIVFTCSKNKKMMIYWFGVLIGIVLIRSLGWYLGELSCYGYMFYNSFLISFCYIVISYGIFYVLLRINIGSK